jgi:apolipoprotein N-acyltransferase
MNRSLDPAALPTSRSPSPCLAPAIFSGALLYLCYFPVAWGWLSWVALVPLLGLVRAQARPRRIYWSAYIGGLCFFVPAIAWMRVADYRMYATWLMLATYCALYFPAGLCLIRLLDRRSPVPLALSVPIVWTALEWLRSFALTGFAWYYLGHAQHRFESIIQVADLGGVYAISFVVAAVNGLLADLLFRMPSLRDRFRWAEPTTVSHGPVVLSAIGVVGLVLAAVVYGTIRLEEGSFEAGPRVALLQGNLDQRIRNQASGPNGWEETTHLMKLHYFGLATLAKMHSIGRPIDLVVWPETSYPHVYVDIPPNVPLESLPQGVKDYAASVLANLRFDVAQLIPAEQLVGLNTEVILAPGKPIRYSSALLVHKNGELGERFDKMHRVPFGEFVPFRDWLPFMNALAPYDHDYSISIGEHFTRFPLGKLTFGSLICYEDTDPFLARRYVQDSPDGKPVDFLVNMSNDGWFDGSAEHDEHLVISRFRAIECRRCLVRAVNEGISAIIDGNGRVLKPQLMQHPELEQGMRPEHQKMIAKFKIWEVMEGPGGSVPELLPEDYAAFKKEPGILVSRLPIDRRESLYARFGDWLPIGCWLGIALVSMFSIVGCVRGRFRSA